MLASSFAKSALFSPRKFVYNPGAVGVCVVAVFQNRVSMAQREQLIIGERAKRDQTHRQFPSVRIYLPDHGFWTGQYGRVFFNEQIFVFNNTFWDQQRVQTQNNMGARPSGFYKIVDFLIFLMFLISSFKQWWSENILDIISVFNFAKTCFLIYGISWRMICAHLRIICILLLLLPG